MADEPLSERVQRRVTPHPDDTHETSSEPAAVPPHDATPPGQPVSSQPQEIVKPQPVPPPAEGEVRTPEPKKVAFETFNATITRMETHHSGLWEFDFVLDKEIKFLPGQYVSVYLQGKKPAPFSIASSPIHKDRLVLGVEIVGDVTGTMGTLSPGDQVILKGPFGRFVIGDHEHKACFLAGGIGITPFMSMLRWIRDASPDKHATLFYSCKSVDQFMWLDELEEMHRSHDSIKIVPTCTQAPPQGWQHRTGRISADMIREELPDFDEYVFFSCGPPKMIEALFAILREMGVPDERLRREAWH